MPENKPPEWIEDLAKTIESCVESEGSLSWKAFLHESDPAWHIDVFPSLVEAEGGFVWYTYGINLSALLATFDYEADTEVRADQELTEISTVYQGHSVHILLFYEPMEEEDPEGEQVPTANELN